MTDVNSVDDRNEAVPVLNGEANDLPVADATASADVSVAIVMPAAPDASEPANGSHLNGTASAATANPQPGSLRVIDIRKNQPDSRGEKIDFVFFQRRNFAIYRSGGKIMVQYADDEVMAARQIANIADLLPLRDRLQSLASGLMSPQACHWQIAEALRLGLDGQKDAARLTMQSAIDEINVMRVRKGRIVYLVYAGALVFTVVALLCAGAAGVVWYATYDLQRDGFGLLLTATGSGSIGALLSTAIALRARSVAIDGDVISNAVDSTVRIMIGVISAAVFFLILSSDVLSKVSLGETPLFEAKAITWKLALLIGFAAGFLERLVPDLLEKRLAPIAK